MEGLGGIGLIGENFEVPLKIILTLMKKKDWHWDLPRTFPGHPWLDTPEGHASLRRILMEPKNALGKQFKKLFQMNNPELNAKMRGILIDWFIEVHRNFNMMPESLYFTINIVDRYLSMRKVARREFQLVGMSAMLIACKYEEIWPPEVNDLIAISDNAYSGEHILVMEKAILGQLGWYLTVPTRYVFLVRY
ncbi:putative cyclin, Rab-GTPase-TBC domain superfamily, Cyclin-like superfamily [Helianthus annuus]|nr:putative cyclin, Rab-GTPase-TBC domain superfamily, Cyclin-like superfamily [Helianthus annuus]